MNWIEKILICEYFAPMAMTTATVFFVERKSKIYPSRDEDELTNRVATSFYALIIFSFIQAIIRAQ